MVIGGSRGCSRELEGLLAPTVCNASGAARGSKFLANKGPGAVYGTMMGLVSGSDRNGVTTSGLTTLSKPRRMMAARFGL